MIITNATQPTIAASNQKVYQRLRVALGLGLRRQIFVVVCDDLSLRNELANRLQAALVYPNEQAQQKLGTGSSTKGGYPRLASLRLNLGDPNPLAQINQWLAKYPPPYIDAGQDLNNRRLPVPGFQILGIEQLTRQPVAIQRLFLKYLQSIGQNISNLEFNLVLWLPRPWLHMIQQSAPGFWCWRTGVFEFVGEPTPVNVASVKGESESQSNVVATTTFERKRRTVSTKHTSGATEANRRHLGLVNSDRQTAAEEEREIVISQTSLDEDLKEQTQLDDLDIQSLPVQPPLPTDVNNTIDVLLTEDPTYKEPNVAVNLEDEAALLKPTPERSARSSDLVADANNQSQAIQELSQLVLTTTTVQTRDGEESLELRVNAQLDAVLQNFQPRQALRQIEQLHGQKASPADLAAAYQHLGDLYRDRIEQGESTPQHLLIAIRAYEQAMTYLPQPSLQTPDILNDLGTLYWMLSRSPSSPDQVVPCLKQGIENYLQALTQIVPQTQHQTYARVQNNLGAAYGDLAHHLAPIENWQQAVLAYSEALHYRTMEADPLKYASTQNNLGTAHWHLAQHQQPILHLQQAIAAYQEALPHYSIEQEPLNYAMVQNNLGTTYWNIAQYEQPADYLQLAINAYRQALKYRTPDLLPAACAATQNNLGTAYWHLANQPQVSHEARQEYLQLCITTYETTLIIAQLTAAKPLSFDVFATHNNLGLAHYQTATDKHWTADQATRSSHLEAALENHLQALQGWQDQPDYYQTALSYVVQTIRAFYNELGLQGQTLALSKVPGHLLPELMRRV